MKLDTFTPRVVRQAGLAAKQAQTVISTLSIFASNPNVVATLRNAKDKAIRAMTTFPSERLLNEARHTIVNVLSDLIHAIEHGPLTQEKIGKAKEAIEVWKDFLEAQH